MLTPHVDRVCRKRAADAAAQLDDGRGGRSPLIQSAGAVLEVGETGAATMLTPRSAVGLTC